MKILRKYLSSILLNYMNPTKNLIEPKPYMNPTKNLIGIDVNLSYIRFLVGFM
jgi:hypothetical protein